MLWVAKGSIGAPACMPLGAELEEAAADAEVTATATAGVGEVAMVR